MPLKLKADPLPHFYELLTAAENLVSYGSDAPPATIRRELKKAQAALDEIDDIYEAIEDRS